MTTRHRLASTPPAQLLLRPATAAAPRPLPPLAPAAPAAPAVPRVREDPAAQPSFAPQPPIACTPPAAEHRAAAQAIEPSPLTAALSSPCLHRVLAILDAVPVGALFAQRQIRPEAQATRPVTLPTDVRVNPQLAVCDTLLPRVRAAIARIHETLATRASAAPPPAARDSSASPPVISDRGRETDYPASVGDYVNAAHPQDVTADEYALALGSLSVFLDAFRGCASHGIAPADFAAYVRATIFYVRDRNVLFPDLGLGPYTDEWASIRAQPLARDASLITCRLACALVSSAPAVAAAAAVARAAAARQA